MFYLIYDKRGMVIDTIFVDPAVSKFKMYEAINSFKREYQIDNSLDFNVEAFRLYLSVVYNIRASTEIKHDRLNLGV